MPRYVSGPGCCGREINPDVPVVFVGRLTRLERCVLRLFGGRVRRDGRLVEVEPRAPSTKEGNE